MKREGQLLHERLCACIQRQKRDEPISGKNRKVLFAICLDFSIMNALSEKGGCLDDKAAH